MRKNIYQHWVVGCNVSTVNTCISWRLGCLEPFAVSSLWLMKVSISPMTEQSLLPGFWSGLDMKQEAEGSGPSPYMLHDEQTHPALRGLPCCWDEEASQTWQGTCCVNPPPCCHHSSAKEPRQEHLHIPPSPCLAFTRL